MAGAGARERGRETGECVVEGVYAVLSLVMLSSSLSAASVERSFPNGASKLAVSYSGVVRVSCVLTALLVVVARRRRRGTSSSAGGRGKRKDP
jgi:hypothetical protein